MPKRKVNTADLNTPQNHPQIPAIFNTDTMADEFRSFINSVSRHLWTAYSMMNGNSVAIVTVVLIVVLSFMLPDISQKMHAKNDLKSMKQFLDLMSAEVNQAEAACLTVADNVCCLKYSVHDDTTETAKNLRDVSVSPSHGVYSTQSEPVQIKEKMSYFRQIFFPHRNTSHKEITIMSYVYTDSFDKKNGEPSDFE